MTAFPVPIASRTCLSDHVKYDVALHEIPAHEPIVPVQSCLLITKRTATLAQTNRHPRFVSCEGMRRYNKSRSADAHADR